MIIAIWIIIGLLVASFGLITLRGAPYVPTHRRQLERAFDELYPLSSADTIVDLGSGDGVVCEVAARRDAAAIGYELNPFLVILSYVRLRKWRRVKIIAQDFMRLETLPADTTVVYAFTTAHSVEAIGRKLQQWSGERQLFFISYGFKLRDIMPIKSVGPMHLYEFASGKTKA